MLVVSFFSDLDGAGFAGRLVAGKETVGYGSVEGCGGLVAVTGKYISKSISHLHLAVEGSRHVRVGALGVILGVVLGHWRLQIVVSVVEWLALEVWFQAWLNGFEPQILKLFCNFAHFYPLFFELIAFLEQSRQALL